MKNVQFLDAGIEAAWSSQLLDEFLITWNQQNYALT